MNSAPALRTGLSKPKVKEEDMNNIKKEERLRDRVAIVTGGAYGIGKAIVFDFAREGSNVVVCDINESNLSETQQEASKAGISITAVKADITKEPEVNRMVEEALKEFGGIDILVNNAAVNGPLGLITEISKKEWNKVLDTNLTGMYLCSKAVLKHMIERGTGNIINLSSGAGLRGAMIRRLPYAVSKFGVEGFTYALAQQIKPYGIWVNAMRPAPADTSMAKDLPPERRAKLRKPEEISKLAVFLALQTVDTMTGESVDFKDWEKNLKEK